jgi:hypothetical protein
MKSKSTLFFLVFCLLAGSLNAQVKKNLIKTSLVFPLAEIFEFSYERVINADKSVQLSVFAGGSMDIGIMPEFRYYLSENQVAPNGVFIAPFAMLSSQFGGGGIMVGIQKLFKEKISLDASLGPFVTGDGVAVMGGLNLGFAF